ncbi:MAG: hypothetical protein JXA15_11245 [Spirochaetales bacterium]|nr:hypothetical protein [Spirochaetales bacterium]
MKPSRPARVIAVLVIAFLAGASYAQTPGASTSSFGAELSIRFWDARVYYTGDSVHVKVTLHNSGAAPFRFKLSESRMFSLSFEARTPSNRLLDASDDYKRTVAGSMPVYYREITLEPGEEYSFVEDASRYVKLDEAGLYTLRAVFLPELLRPGESGTVILSNALSLSLRPAAGLPASAPAVSDSTGDVLRPEKISPDEVVRRTIAARQKGRWEEFFLYLDVESLLRRNEGLRLRYDRESDEARLRMIEAYKADLRLDRVDTDIVVIPTSFEIVQTAYTASYGTVTVVQKFAYPGFSMIKDYVYELSRRDDVWYVVGYSVRNRGTE